MSTWALPRAPLTWSLFCAEGPTAPPPNLGLFHRVSPLCCEVLLSRGLTFWVPTHAPQSLVTRPGGVSTFLSYHARGPPWSWPSHGSCLSQGLPTVAWILHESGLSPTGTRTYGLEATFLFSLLLFWTVEARCLSWAMSLLRRCLTWAMSYFRRRLTRAMSRVPPCVWHWLLVNTRGRDST